MKERNRFVLWQNGAEVEGEGNSCKPSRVSLYHYSYVNASAPIRRDLGKKKNQMVFSILSYEGAASYTLHLYVDLSM